MESIYRKFSPESLFVKGMPTNFATPTADQEYPLGAKFEWRDRVFYYGYAGGTALAAGKLMTPAAMAVEVNKAVAAAAAIGDTKIIVTTAAAQLYLEGGTLVVNDVTGEGCSYPIEYSEANADTATSTDVYLALPLTLALTTSSEVELYSSKYYDLDLSAAVTDMIAGVPFCAITANYYAWFQTWGTAAVLCGATTAAGQPVITHTTDGSVAPYTAANATAMVSNIVGYALTNGTAGEYNGVYLTLSR